MTSLRIHHRTTYRYRQPVAFGPHRLMLRPRESRDLRLIEFELGVTPTAKVTWAHDVWGNAVASAGVQSMHDMMLVESVAQIELDAAAWPGLSSISPPPRSSTPSNILPTNGRIWERWSCLEPGGNWRAA